MSNITLKAIASSSDGELFSLLGKELGERIKVGRDSDQFLSEIRKLPLGLRAMAATYELDVSLALDDLGWHFFNWHDGELAMETANGLEELGASELARIFTQAFRLAQLYWAELDSEDWIDWYLGSPMEVLMEPLNDRAWSLLKDEPMGILQYWVNYARKHPDRIGARGNA
jgi:hypothetical protein